MKSSRSTVTVGPGRPVRLAFLGPPTVLRDGRRVGFDTRKAVALLAWLAAAREERPREALAALLWPEADEARARSSLRRTLSVTVAELGDALVGSRATLSLREEAVSCDLWELERLASTTDLEELEGAVRLWRGDFLEGFAVRGCPEFDAWQSETGEQCRRRFGEILGRLVSSRLERGEFPSALAHAERRLSLDPLDESAHRSLMRVAAAAGDRTRALRQYRICVRVLSSELGVPPLPETTSLYEEIRSGKIPPEKAPPPLTAPDVAASGRSERPLLGQERVLDRLVARWRDTRGSGASAGLHGPSGSGKTAILAELARAVAATGGTVVGTRCFEAERDLAFGTVTGLLDSVLRAAPDVAEGLPQADLVEIGRLQPALLRSLQAVRPAPIESEAEKVRLFQAVAHLLAACSEERAVLVTVDDAHWIDDASAQLLGYLIRRPGTIRLFTVVAWQQESGLRVALRSALDDACLEGGGVLVTPRLLAEGDIARLVSSSDAPSLDAETLVAQTGGLPLLVTAYLDDPEARGADGRGAVPVGVRELLSARIARAPEATAQVLAAVAVLGGHCEPDLVRATSGRSPAEVADALDDAVRRGLLVEESRASEDGYSFPYDALRQVVHDACGMARRRLLHGRAADYLAGRSSATRAPALVADHLRRAGREHEAAAWEWRAAERSAQLFAHEEAAVHARSALELGHAGVEAHSLLASQMIALGRYDEALTELEAAAADAGEGQLVEIERRLAAVHERLGDFAAAAAHLDAALDLSGGDAVAHARSLADRAFVAYRLLSPSAAVMARDAVAEAERCGDGLALAQALNVSGVCAAASGEKEKAESLLRRSAQESASLLVSSEGRARSNSPLREPGPRIAALNNLARLLADTGRLEEALSCASEALELGLSYGDVHRCAALHSNLADLLHAAGQGRESLEHLKQSAALFASVVAAGGDEIRPEVWTLVDW